MALVEQLVAAESNTLSEALVSDIKQEDQEKLVRDTSQLVNPYFDDLVSNHVHQNQSVFNHSNMVVMNDDTPPNEDIPHILNIIDDIIDNPEKYIKKRSIYVKIPSDALYTADAQLGNALGWDRLHDFTSTSLHKKKYDDNLRHKNGFSDAASAPLVGYFRWVVDPFSLKPYKGTISKICGNGRDYMKVTANGGGVCDHIMKLNFHNINLENSYQEYQQLESNGFVTDQQLQCAHNGYTKFIAGVKSGDTQWVALRDFLKGHDLDFSDVVYTTTGSVMKFQISTYDGFSYGKAGKPGNDVREFSSESILYALNTLKEIQIIREKLGFSELKGTKSVSYKHISNSGWRTLIRMFAMLTEPFTDTKTQIQHQPLQGKDWLKKQLVFKYTQHNATKSRYISCLAELNMKKIKDFYYVALKTNILPILTEMELEENRQNRIMDENPIIKRFISKVSIDYLQDDIKSLIRNR